MKGDGIPLTPASVLYYRVKTYLPESPSLHGAVRNGSVSAGVPARQ
jgi:hypothetical protein